MFVNKIRLKHLIGNLELWTKILAVELKIPIDISKFESGDFLHVFEYITE